jgi:hypothetical protein
VSLRIRVRFSFGIAVVGSSVNISAENCDPVIVSLRIRVRFSVVIAVLGSSVNISAENCDPAGHEEL